MDICPMSGFTTCFTTFDKVIGNRITSNTNEMLTFLLKLLEISGHGILWLVLTFSGIILSHRLHIHEKLLNLLLGKCKKVLNNITLHNLK